MELEINGTLADLPATTKGLIRLNKSVAALSDLDTRTGEYSWPFSLPATRRNAGIFGQILHPQTLDKYRAVGFPFVLRAGGVAWRGTFYLDAIRNGYTGTLSTESLGWATGLGEKKLPELTTLQPVAYDGTQLEQLLLGTCDTQDLQFPLLAYGNFFSPPTLDAEGEELPAASTQVMDTPLAVAGDYFPSVYYANVVRAIVREAGYYAAGPIFSDPEFRRWCITAAGSSGDFWPWGILIPASRAASAPEQQFSNHIDGDYTNTAEAFDVGPDVMYFLPRVPNVVRAGGTRALAPTGKAEFFAPSTGTYGFTWEATLGNTSQFVDREGGTSAPYFAGFAPVVLGLVVFRQGEGYEGADGGICTSGTGQYSANQQRVVSAVRLDNPGNFTLRANQFFSGSKTGLYLEAGDTVRLLIFTRRVYSQLGDGINRYTRERFTLETAGLLIACTAFDGPTALNPAAVLPPITQKSLLRDFMVKTNTVPLLDADRRTVHFLSREQYTQAQGAPINLNDVADPQSLEYLPVFGTTARLVFSPTEAPDAAAPLGTDVVSLALGAAQAPSDKAISSPFAATGTVRFATATGPLDLPCAATVEELATSRSEASQNVADKAPRVVVYEAPDPAGPMIPFQNRTVAPGRGRYVGSSAAWDGNNGVVATRYRDFVAAARRGHLCRVQCSLTPSLYTQLSAGRRVDLLGAQYTLESITGYDPAAATLATLTLLRYV